MASKVPMATALGGTVEHDSSSSSHTLYIIYIIYITLYVWHVWMRLGRFAVKLYEACLSFGGVR